jgi:hypothetical protein
LALHEIVDDPVQPLPGVLAEQRGAACVLAHRA